MTVSHFIDWFLPKKVARSLPLKIYYVALSKFHWQDKHWDFTHKYVYLNKSNCWRLRHTTGRLIVWPITLQMSRWKARVSSCISVTHLSRNQPTYLSIHIPYIVCTPVNCEIYTESSHRRKQSLASRIRWFYERDSSDILYTVVIHMKTDRCYCNTC